MRTTFHIFKNANPSNPGKYHIVADNGELSTGEEMSIQRFGAFRLKREAEKKAAELRAEEKVHHEWPFN